MRFSRASWQNRIIWTFTLVSFFFVVYFLFNINKNTDENVVSVKDAVTRLEKDHDGQDQLLQCLVNLFIEKKEITRVDVDNCVIETSVPPPTQTNGGTEPSSPAVFPVQPSATSSNTSSSSTNDNPPNNSSQPDNSQTEDPPKSILPLIDEPIIGCPLGVCI